MINSIATLMFCIFAAQSGDQTVLSTAERFFYSHEYQRAADMIDSHIWTDDSLWSEAGLIRELCDGGWSIECPVMAPGDFQPFKSIVTVSFTGEFQLGDSVRIIIPVPISLPWQIPSDPPVVTITGIAGSSESLQGWFELKGVSEGLFEIEISQEIMVTPPVFPGVDAPGNDDAMVPFPGEDAFLDRCLDTTVFWAGGDAVYMKSSVLAAREPNPMRLVERVIDDVSVYFSSSNPVTEQALLYPLSDLALQNEMFNSAGGASLGAAVLRRWQIPALVIPGFRGNNGSPGFLLATYVKPFGWMVISSYPDGFVALGTFDPPNMKSWFNGLPGVTFQAEYLGTDGFWHAVPFDSPEFVHTVEIITE